MESAQRTTEFRSRLPLKRRAGRSVELLTRLPLQRRIYGPGDRRLRADRVARLCRRTRGERGSPCHQEAAAGRSPLDPGAASRLLLHFRGIVRGREEIERLTDQEQKVLDLIARGMTNREIAEALDLAEKTIKNYVSSILSKLQLKRRTEAAVFIARRRAGGEDGLGT